MWAFGSYGGYKICKQYSRLKETHHFGDLDIDGTVILNRS